MNLEVTTKDRVVYSDEVDMVSLPAWDGEMGVLADHADFIILLGKGLLRVQKQGQAKAISIDGGYAEISNNRIVVLPDTVYDIKDTREGMEG